MRGKARRDAARQSLRILYAAGPNFVSILYGLRAFCSDATSLERRQLALGLIQPCTTSP
jgi:hypothetical protein